MKIKPGLRNWFGAALLAASLVSAQTQSLWDIVVATEDLSTLKAAVEAAELESALQGAAPLTVFAPNNAAFAALPEGALEGLLADIPQLTAVLTYHVLAGTQLAADLTAGDYVTLNGASVTVTTPEGLVKVNDATVIGADVLASNGVAHVIDSVLLPAGPPPPQSLWDIVVATEDLSTLKAAVEAAELESALQGAAPLTVFAPNNAAFAALPEGALDDLLADIPQLTAVLTYHVLAGTQLAADLTAGDYVTLNGASVTVTTPEGLVKVNDATVIGADVLASNGVAHVIDSVLLPAGPPPPQSLWDIVVATEDLSTLKAAVEAAGLESALQGTDPLTVFAPNNAAFAALPEGALDDLLADIPQLTAVLTYHVLAGTQLAADLTAGDYVTLNGASVTVTTPEGMVKVNDATVIGADVLASNGVAHVIDSVLLPAGPPPPPSLWDIVVATEDLSTLKAAVEAAELESALQGAAPLTVFAPNNAAFAALPEGALDDLLADIPQLTAVLTYHVLAGTQLAADLTAGDYVTLNGASVTVTTPEGLVKVNDATVIGADVVASNGVAHVIDSVLLPAGPPPPQSLWDIVVATEDLSTLKAAVEAAGLESALQGAAPLTVFAPNNAAFAALPEGALDDLLADIPQLTAVLTYHVLEGTRLAADLTAGDYVTLNGTSVTVTTPEGMVKVNDATVIGADVVATNGVAHVIDSVLLPPKGNNVAWVSFHAADDEPSIDAAAAGFTLAPDIGYTDLLKSRGHQVTRIVTSGTPDAGLLNRFDLVIISRSVPSGDYQNDNATRWNAIETPMIIMGGYVLRQNRLGYTTGNTIPDTDRTISLTLTDPEHPVFAGIDLDEENTMLNPFADIVTFGELVQLGISVNTDPVAGDGTVLATVGTEGDPAFGGMVIGEWQAGATMGNSNADILAGHRLVFLSGSREQGITSQAAGIYDLTGDGARMFLNAVKYMAVAKTVIAPPVIQDGNITITWSGEGQLETATDINGPWTGTGNTSGTFTEELGDGNKYYRVNRAP
jgi:uncharacterized surface protein with fasciclin (FAS1) repeats